MKKRWLIVVLLLSLCFDTAGVAFADETNDVPWKRIDTKAVYETAPFYQAINDNLVALNNRYPDITQIRNIGTSVDGNAILAIKVGSGKDKILVLGGQHGRESMSALLVLHQAEEAVLDYKASNSLIYGGYQTKKILDDVSIWFVPLLNPDGAEIAMHGTSYIKHQEKLSAFTAKGFNLKKWKANLNGVDLNRNYGTHMDGSATWPDFAYYGGPQPYSEPETKAIMDFTREEDIKGVINCHAAGQLVYWDPPYGDIAYKLSEVTGYSLVPPSKAAPWPTYDTWYFSEFGRPVFTIEIGEGALSAPLEYTAYKQIWIENWLTPIVLAREIQKRQPIEVLLDGMSLTFDAPPLRLDSGEVLVPVRGIFEALGATVTWDAERKTVTAVKEGETVSVNLEQNTLTDEYGEHKLEVPSQIVNSRFFAHMRPIVESMGAKITWDNYTKCAYITTTEILGKKE